MDDTPQIKKMTVMMEEDMVRKIKEIQAELLPFSRKYISFSKVMTDILKISFARQEEMGRSEILAPQYGLTS